MLRFAENPDVIFTQILDRAFDHAIDLMIRRHIEEPDPGQWKDEFPRASRVFSPEAALATVKELQKYNKDESGLWELNDYHYCLIYEILEDFCTVENESARDFDRPIAIIGETKIWEVDFEAITEIYFPDTDFLMPRDRMEGLGEEEKKQFGYRPETFSIAMGFKPHPDELIVKLWEKGNFTPRLPADSLYSKSTGKYPELVDDEKD